MYRTPSGLKRRHPNFAAARHAGLDLKGKRVGVIISGGNVDVARFSELIAK